MVPDDRETTPPTTSAQAAPARLPPREVRRSGDGRARPRFGDEAGVEREPVRTAAVRAGRHRTSATGDLNRYSDHRATAVREALAERLEPSPDVSRRLWLGRAAPAVLLAPDGIVAMTGCRRSFEAYPIYTAVSGTSMVAVREPAEALDMAGLARP